MTERLRFKAGTAAWLWWSAVGIVLTFGVLGLLSRWLPTMSSVAAGSVFVVVAERRVLQVFPRRAPQWLVTVAYSATFVGLGLVLPALWPDTWQRDSALVGLVIGIVVLSFGVVTAVFAERYVPRRLIDAEIERYRRSVEDA
ncbi:hypothetical protein GA0004736_1161 [Curtobacterium sp. 9128]|uniref:hypothetical protein n=1 Tax=Curtobacterium sp. 9128 TaxID=1793722 RepID=UPI0007D71F92|nr:hypothetical protein [Curtobacterium sp. 9128]SBN62261.1 hypothetical protein GA0004736_1161 [Curtobacterium sp. 9128]